MYRWSQSVVSLWVLGRTLTMLCWALYVLCRDSWTLAGKCKDAAERLSYDNAATNSRCYELMPLSNYSSQ